MKKIIFKMLIVIVLVTLLIPTTVFAKGKPVIPPDDGGETAANNLSFPVIAVDGFGITPLTNSSFTVTYPDSDPTTQDYAGLTAEEIIALELSGPWYPQKTLGNAWQAEYSNGSGINDPVTYVDWSDNIESLNPKIGRSFRLELVLFHVLTTPMTAYTMACLEYPSSANELQGTNNTTYESPLATVISPKPGFIVQYIDPIDPTDLVWDVDHWEIPEITTDTGTIAEVVPTIIPISFAPELNVGGKYIYGASEGGWKPTVAGTYRLTFYIPNNSTIDLTETVIGALPSAPVAAAVVDPANNLTCIDVTVVSGGGGGGGKRPN